MIESPLWRTTGRHSVSVTPSCFTVEIDVNRLRREVKPSFKGAIILAMSFLVETRVLANPRRRSAHEARFSAGRLTAEIEQEALSLRRAFAAFP